MSDIVSRGATPRASSDDRITAALLYGLLFLAPFFGGLTLLVAPVIAYVRRPLSDSLHRTHYDFQIRLFWIGLTIFVASLIAAIWGAFVMFGAPAGIGDLFSEGYRARVADAAAGGFHVSGLLVVLIAGLAIAADIVWLMLASVFGLARLLSDEPIGRLKGA